MELSIEIALQLFFAAMLAGWVDTIAGGGGLITIPAMLTLGIPPAVTLATNKVQGSSGTLVASLYFLRKGAIDLQKSKWSILMTFIGSIVGGWLVLQINSEALKTVLPVLLILMGLYFLLSPTVEDIDREPRIPYALFSAFVAPLLGFYDGFFGPGTGTFMTLAFVVLSGYSLSKATANAKIHNFTSNFSALLYFVLFGKIYWGVALVMMIGQTIGSYLGAKMVTEKGVALIKPVVVTVCFLMSMRLLLKF
ncbi:MAG: TSUP family transporter [Coleofasciculaceae cyanobacterium SM2_1_6]|nr:TSUP family transporter [Coleofasciculaceae cyanobacterium SM2_1_6]